MAVYFCRTNHVKILLDLMPTLEHAEMAVKNGEVLLKASPTPQQNVHAQGQPASVVFYAPNLFQESPAIPYYHPVGDAIF
jgi:hypothetical protein